MAFRIEAYRSRNFTVEFSNDNHLGNQFTIVIGPNGSGKSRLLAEIASAYAMQPSSEASIFPPTRPNRIIALTNMVYDRFPHTAKSSRDYFYLGVRQGTNMVTTGVWVDQINNSMAHLSTNPTLMDRLKPALRMLGLELNGGLQVARAPRAREMLLRSMEKSFNSEYRPQSDYELDIFKAMLLKIPTAKRKDELFEEADSRWANFDEYKECLQEADIDNEVFLEYCIKNKLIWFRQIFSKNGRSLLAGDLSSGEQLVLSNSLRLLVNLRAESLVLLDEPEVGLHPAWQGQFIQLLSQMFPAEYGCHFIIATHSPHVVVEGTNLLVPSGRDGDFVPFKGAIDGRSVEDVLYRAFESRSPRNQNVERDLELLIRAIGSPSYMNTKLHGILAAVNRLSSLTGSDTPEINRIVTQVLGILSERAE